MKVVKHGFKVIIEEGADLVKVLSLKKFPNAYDIIVVRRGSAFFNALFNHFTAAAGRSPRAAETFSAVFAHDINAIGRVPRGDISFAVNFIHATVSVGATPRGDVEFIVNFTHDTAGEGRAPRELVNFVASYTHDTLGKGATARFVVAFTGLFSHETIAEGRTPREVLHFSGLFTHETKGVGVAPSVPQLLLDEFPGAAAAYSLRKLRAGFTGAPIRVRRSVDDAEQDIGFNSSGELDTAALMAFVGSGDGVIAKLYKQDESSFSIDLIQTVLANQPYIVIGGQLVVNPDNGLPAIRATREFDNGAVHALVGSQDMADNFNYQNGSIVSVTKSLISSRNAAYGWTASFNTSIRVGFGIGTTGNLVFRNNLEGQFGNDNVTTQTALFYQRGGTGTVNNLSPNLTTGGDATSLTTPFTLFKYTSSLPCEHLFQELVVWNFNQDANRDNIVSSINSRYNAY